MLDVEFQLKQEKCLCFRCDEKYNPDHRCKSKEARELRVLLVNDAEEIELLQGASSEDEEEIPILDVKDLVELD